MKKISNLLIMAMLAIGMGLTSCDEQLDNAVTPSGVMPVVDEVSSIEIDLSKIDEKYLDTEKTKLLLTVGDEVTLSFTILPEEMADTKVELTADDETILSIDGLKVKALKVGETKVTAKAGDKTAECTVTVKAATTPLDNATTAWTAGTFAVPAGGLTYSDAITVSGDVTLVLTDGVTLTLNKGISLAEGATLTIQGNGTMNVNGSDNSTASTVAGSTGTLILTSGTLSAKGGNGGNAGVRSYMAKTAAGGAAISGSVTISAGAVVVIGGNAGTLSNNCNNAVSGAGGAAIVGNATLTGGSLTKTDGTGGGSQGGGTRGAAGKAVVGTVTDNR